MKQQHETVAFAIIISYTVRYLKVTKYLHLYRRTRNTLSRPDPLPMYGNLDATVQDGCMYWLELYAFPLSRTA